MNDASTSPDPTQVDPILLAFAQVTLERGVENATEHAARNARIAATQHLRHQWADEAAEVRRYGKIAADRRAARERLTQRISEAQSCADRLAAAKEEADEAAAVAARAHASMFANNGGKPTAESRAADAAARDATKRLADLELEVGTSALAAAKSGADLLGQADTAVAEADVCLARAKHTYLQKRGDVLIAQMQLMASMLVRPLMTELWATHAAARDLIDRTITTGRDARSAARDGVLVRPSGYGEADQAKDELIAALRTAAGVDETWRHRRSNEERDATLPETPLRARPESWRGVTI